MSFSAIPYYCYTQPLWASDYWSANVYQQANNNLNNADKSPYGKKGDTRWQMIALSEGWANYREELLARRYLGKPNYIGTSHALLSGYVKMFRSLQTLGCSYSNLEKSLCAYSIRSYRDNLIAKYPTLKVQITNTITPYE